MASEISPINESAKPEKTGFVNDLGREWDLISSIPSEIGGGIVDRAQQVLQHPWQAAVDVGASFAIGAGLTYLSKDPDSIGLVARYIPKGLLALTGLDIGRRLAGPMIDTWNHPGNLSQDKQWLGDNLGAAAIDYPLVALGGYAGDRITSGLLTKFDSGSLLNDSSTMSLRATALKHGKKFGSYSLNAPVALGMETVSQRLFPTAPDNPSFPHELPVPKVSSYADLQPDKPAAVIPESGYQLTQQNPTATFGINVDKSGPVRLDLNMDGPGTDWSKNNDESAVASIYVDGKYTQDMVLFAGSQNNKYSFALDNLSAGKHTVTVRFAGEKSTRDATGIDITSGTAEQYSYANKTDQWVDQYAPVLYGLNGIENNSMQAPMALYHAESNNGNGTTTINYGYVYSNEDGGTGSIPAVEQARWGRMTDIQAVLQLTVNSKSGAIEDIEYQGPNDTWKPFQGSFQGTHPIIRTATANDDVSDSGTDDLKYQLEPDYQVPNNGPVEELQRENPLWWKTSSEEIEREGKVDYDGDGDTPNDSAWSEFTTWFNRYALGDIPKMGDPRNYVYVEQDQENASSSDPIADEIVLKNGKTYVSDFGYKDVGIGRNGWVQTDVLLPPNTKPSDIARLEFLSRGSGDAKVVGTSHIYMLNQNYVPQDIKIPVDLSTSNDPTNSGNFSN